MPAILASKWEDLIEKATVLQARGGSLHLDVMDAQLVPANTVNLNQDLEQLRQLFENLTLEVHLMVQEPLNELATIKALGAQRAVIHQECASNEESWHSILRQFQEAKIEPVITCFPNHQIKVENGVDSYQIMGVEPGRAGQKLLVDTIRRVELLRQNPINSDMIISVDGGVNFANGGMFFAEGADRLVMNTAFWQADNPEEKIKQLTT